MAGVALLLPLLGSPAVADTPDSVGVCTDGGVTVVVDLTDLDGEVEIGCAEGEPATGREALESAGFTTSDSEPGFICAINDQPDPCPEEFDGNFWGYYTAEEGDEWASSMEGADTSEPVPGSFEGWRYNDGSEPPAFDPVSGTLTGAEEPSADTESSPADDATAETDEDDATEGATDDATDDAQDTAIDLESGIGSWGVVGIIALVALILAVVGWLVSRRRQQN